jgi:hypothetical protein
VKLYQLTDEWNAILQALAEAETPEEEAAAHERLASVADSLETKLENIAKIRATLLAEAEAYKAEAARLTARRISRENAADRLKRYAESGMREAGLREVKGEVFTLKIQKNNPSVLVTDEKAIPAPFWIEQEPKLDKRSLLDALKSGEVPGAEIQRTESIRIR